MNYTVANAHVLLNIKQVSNLIFKSVGINIALNMELSPYYSIL